MTWSKITKWLYISDIDSTHDDDLYYEEDVEVVISLIWDCESMIKVRDLESIYNVEHYIIPINDDDTSDISNALKQTWNIVEDANDDRKILIHCQLGQCISVAAAIYCVANVLKCDYDKAESFVKFARTESNISNNFTLQLRKLLEEVFRYNF